MTETELNKLIKGVANILEPVAETAAKQHADRVLGHVLDTDDSSLKHRINQVLKAAVAEAVKEHITIMVKLND